MCGHNFQKKKKKLALNFKMNARNNKILNLKRDGRITILDECTHMQK